MALLTPKEWPSYLDAYMYTAGESEIPDEYHKWCAISIMAACLGRRVWTKKGHMTIFPNLYTYLLGPSANGKSAAINFAMRILNKVPYNSQSVNPIQGSATSMGIFDMLGTRVREGTYSAEQRTAVAPQFEEEVLEESLPFFWVCPELANSLGSQKVAQSVIYLLTDLYEGHETTIQDIKRGSGHVLVKAPIVNWLAGSTVEWFIDIVPAAVMEGGFIGRVILIEEGYTSKRYLEPLTPPNADEMFKYLQRVLYHISRLNGELQMTQQARDIDEEWYKSRQPPSEPSLIPGWRRQHDLARKLAMLVSIGDPDEWAFAQEFPEEPPMMVHADGSQEQLSHADAWWKIPGEHSMLIKSHHMQKGHQLSYAALRFAAKLATRLDDSRMGKLTEKVAQLVKQKQVIAHSAISQKIGGSVKRKELHEAYEKLVELGQIRKKQVVTPKGRTMLQLVWRGNIGMDAEWWQRDFGKDDEEDEC